MNKKLLLFLTAMLFSMASGFAQGGTTGPLTWNISGNTLTISGNGAMPDYYQWSAPWFQYQENINICVIEVGVTTIGNWAFGDCSSLTSITIPNSVTTIGNNAFSNCTSLITITIPNSVTTIEGSAFYGCTSLTSIIIPNSVTTIGDGVFYGCTSLTSIIIPNSVTTIGDGAFIGCTSLTSITIPNSITTIGNSFFYYCTSLTMITIPNSVTTIGGMAFYGCSSLPSITIPSSVTTIENGAFGGCISLTSIDVESGNNIYASENGVLFDKNKTTLFCCPNGKIGDYVIPNSVITIGDGAFSGCAGLTSITIPSSVTTIGDGAFSCWNLTSFDVESGNNAYASENGVLFDKSKNTLIRFPQGKTGDTYVIPGSVTTIGNGAFSYCWNLSSITIPNNVITIGNSAFYNCIYLTSITIPNSVTTIGGWTFSGCSSLPSITIPNNVTTIENSAFSYCENLSSITIPNSVKTIGERAFSFCKSLISITIPNSVTSIENGTFYGCTSLTSITIPNSVTTIGNAFNWCTSLTSITLPCSVTAIGYNAFSDCPMTSIINLNPVPIELNDYFTGINYNECTLVVPTSAVSAYKAAEVWKEFNIVGGGILVNPVSSNLEHGYTSGDGLYDANTTATVTATAHTGYKFTNWTKNGVELSTENPYSFTVTEDVELVANFTDDVGIDELQITNYELRVYPNPTTGELSIDNGDLTVDNVEIFDIYGKKISSHHLIPSSSNHLINISHLPAGIYFLKVGNETVKIVKQ